MTRPAARTVVLAFVFAALAGSASRAEAQYTYTKIMVPNSTWTEAFGINNAGQVVGTYEDAAGVTHGFLLIDGKYSDVDFPGKKQNYALGIGNAGQIVGSLSPVSPVGPWSASLLENGVWSAYDFPGRETDARAINASGQIVGIYNAGVGTPDHGFLKVGTSYTSIDYPGATYTYVLGLNDAGYITGTYLNASGVANGFIYLNGAFAPIAHPTASQTVVGGINNLNALVGWKTEAGKTSGFLLSAGAFRPVIVPFANTSVTMPHALNDGGAIVGSYTSPDCTVACGFLATPVAGAAPLCEQTVSLTYGGGTLVTNFTLRTNQSTTWSTWLFVQGVAYRLWSELVPAINPAASLSAPIPTGPIGTVQLVSVISTAGYGAVCVDFAAVNTSAPGQP